ncbi:hypothetical protein LTR41_002979 [Exophiala xenobiotica]|nr:hypothetical protein LTR41_002979 [Exophiala xenobiotica]
MSLLHNLLVNIAEQGGILEGVLGDDTGHLFEPTPWKTYDQELPPRGAWEASQKIVADCEALIALLTPTKIKLVTECIANNSTVALGVAADFKVADKIIENGGEVSLGRLAELCDTDEHKLGSVMRLLCHRHIFAEVAPDVFRNNRHSYELRSETGATGMMLIETEEGYQAGLGWVPTMKDPVTKHDIDPGKGAFAKAFGIDVGVGPWLSTPEGSKRMEKWVAGIPWLSSITVVATRTDLPWDSYGPTLCDVGCGPGSVALDVKKNYPHLNIVCQDLEPMIPVIKETFKGYEDEIAAGRIKIEAHDYFTPQTTIADVYWLRGVVRDYEDDVSAEILRQLIPALKKNPRARVLVNELIVPSLITPPSTANAPASQHLPTEQSAYPSTCHVMSLSTMVLMGGKERTFSDIVKIGEKAGLRFRRFHQFRMFTGTVEFELAPETGRRSSHL